MNEILKEIEDNQFMSLQEKLKTAYTMAFLQGKVKAEKDIGVAFGMLIDTCIGENNQFELTDIDAITRRYEITCRRNIHDTASLYSVKRTDNNGEQEINISTCNHEYATKSHNCSKCGHHDGYSRTCGSNWCRCCN